MGMKTAVIIDPTCDLPASYIQRHQLHLLPNKLILGDQILTDTRDVNLTLAFHHRHALSRNLEALAEPYSTSAIAGLFLDHLVTEYDRAILIATSQTHSQLFQNATEASFAILRCYRERRRRAGLATPFYLNVLDSKTLFAGQAVLVHEVIRLLQNQNLPFNELRGLIEQFRPYIRCYLLFDDLSYVHHEVSRKSEKSIEFLNYGLNSLLGIKPVARFVNGETEWVLKARGFDRALSDLFERVKLEIDQGLRSSLVALSYAGDPEPFKQKRAFVEFERHARQWGIEVMVSVMSATGGLHVGPGAVSLAFAAA